MKASEKHIREFNRKITVIRKEEVKYIQENYQRTSPKQLKCMKIYNENECNKSDLVPALYKICLDLYECMHKKTEKINLSQLIFSKIGQIIDDFVKELNDITITLIFIMSLFYIFIMSQMK